MARTTASRTRGADNIGLALRSSNFSSKSPVFACKLAKAGHRGFRRSDSLTQEGTYDDHAGKKAARQATLPRVPWQRCKFHVMQNAMAHVPKMAMNVEVAAAP